MSYTDTDEYKLQRMADYLLTMAEKNPAISKRATFARLRGTE